MRMEFARFFSGVFFLGTAAEQLAKCRHTPGSRRGSAWGRGPEASRECGRGASQERCGLLAEGGPGWACWLQAACKRAARCCDGDWRCGRCGFSVACGCPAPQVLVQSAARSAGAVGIEPRPDGLCIQVPSGRGRVCGGGSGGSGGVGGVVGGVVRGRRRASRGERGDGRWEMRRCERGHSAAGFGAGPVTDCDH